MRLVVFAGLLGILSLLAGGCARMNGFSPGEGPITLETTAQTLSTNEIGSTPSGSGSMSQSMVLPTIPVQPPLGAAFQFIRAPLSLNYHGTKAKPGKIGRAVHYYFRIPIRFPLIPVYPSFAWSDPEGLKRAAAQGGLHEIEYADYEVISVLGIYTRFTIIAYGR